MESGAATEHQPATASSSGNPSRGRNRRRGGHRGPQRPSRGNGSAPASQSGPLTVESQADGQASQNGRSMPRGGTLGRPRKREHIMANLGTSTAAGRQFSGRLTNGTSQAGLQNPPSLRANAPLFVPGQVHPAGAAHKQASGKRPAVRKNSLSRSIAPDLPTRIHEDITRGLYECSICTSEVKRKSKVWSCTTCWTVFHLDCIEQWSKQQRSAARQPQLQNGEDPPPFQWRCPGCNLMKDDIPLFYSCWCGKEIDPRSTGGLPPHSCGQTCSRPRSVPKNCPHPCELSCHAGPCPPCSHMGPVQSCFCGKEALSRRCAETDYEKGWSCGAICGEMLPCGEHICNKSCHEGLCGSCDVKLDVKCYCGKVSKVMECCDTLDRRESTLPKDTSPEDESQSAVESSFETWSGVFECGQPCGRMFDCGVHPCEKTCHPQNGQPSHCPSSPDIVTKCHCGKTLLSDILDEPRQSCSDPIPCCTRTCEKRLPCGHACKSKCHTDNCPPCTNIIDISCRCGRATFSTICHRQSSEPLMCLRLCKAKLSCGRHECGEHCCPGERLALDRTSSKRRLRSLAPFADTIEAEHICTRICGRKLRCGNHDCPELCHRGGCGSCREAIFEEVACHCGKTVLQPPLPCGTGPPPCRFECERVKSCGHPQVSHNCHTDDESCPKCPFLVEKVCMCTKKTLKNQPCFLSDARCGEVCGKKLRCGAHFCRKSCHRPGDCEDANTPCQQPCGEAKKICGHPCDSPCHSPYPCKEEKPCQSKVIITCDCQNLKTETKCQASKKGEGNKSKSLKCDDECARLARNHQLALALNIDPVTHQDDHIPYAAETLRLYHDDITWAQEQEKELRLFAADDEARRMRHKPMKPNRRAFLHALAEDFGLDSESLDPEPHRHVCIFKTPKFVKAPMKTLADCMRIRARTATVAATATSIPAAPAAPARTALAENNVPFNAYLLASPRFALTVDELIAAVGTVKSGAVDFTAEFLPSEEVVLRAKPTSDHASASFVESSLKSLKPAMADAVLDKKLAASLKLCAVDASLNILRRETTDVASSGWSLVAARAAGPKAGTKPAPVPSVGSKTTFTVLSKTRDKAKTPKPAPVEVADDWEAEMEKEELAETAAAHLSENEVEDTTKGTTEKEAGHIEEQVESQHGEQSTEQAGEADTEENEQQATAEESSSLVVEEQLAAADESTEH